MQRKTDLTTALDDETTRLSTKSLDKSVLALVWSPPTAPPANLDAQLAVLLNFAKTTNIVQQRRGAVFEAVGRGETFRRWKHNPHTNNNWQWWPGTPPPRW